MNMTPPNLPPLIVSSTSPYFFESDSQRILSLRGVNLSGSAKLPFTPHLPTHVTDPKTFYSTHRDVSFVGRPFPLSEADQHFARLRHWGFNFIRFNTTWEALEHAGPGLIDHDYIEYVIEILRKAREYGFRCFIDPHQDVWSRFSGGSGAPGWTFELAGLDIRRFHQTGAALVQNNTSDPASFPKMIWPTNYYKLACATMFTLFFGGNVFAPKCLVDNRVNIQDFLQNHYCNAIAALAKRIHEETNLEDSVVLGYDTLNEPSGGWIGVHDLLALPAEQELKMGITPTPFQAMMMGQGLATPNVEVYDFTNFGPRLLNTITFDSKGVSCWLENRQCVWATHGVWDISTQTCLIPDYFSRNPETNQSVDFLADFWKPFVRKFTLAIRQHHPRAIMFIEPPVNTEPPKFSAEQGDPTERLVFTPHWYDGLTLTTKHFNEWFTVDYIGFKRGLYSNIVFALRFGEAAIKKCWRGQLEFLRKEGIAQIGNFPSVLGETGIPFDMDNRVAYETGDYSMQIKAMDTLMTALETSAFNFTIWNYCSDNSHEWGDNWNGEDLSIWSKSIPTKLVKSRILDSSKSSRSSSPFSSSSDNVDYSESLGSSTKWLATRSPGEPTVSTTTSSKTATLSKTATAAAASSQNHSAFDYSLDFDLDLGGRAVPAFCRPYAIRSPGIPVSQLFDLATQTYRFSFKHPDRKSNDVIPSNWECEIYLPRLHYPFPVEELDVWVTGGKYHVTPKDQRLFWICSGSMNEPIGGDVTIQDKLLDDFSSLEQSGVLLKPDAIVHTILIKPKRQGEKSIENLLREKAELSPSTICPSSCPVM